MGGLVSTHSAQVPLLSSLANASVQWSIANVINEHGFDIWSSDGYPVRNVPRGGIGRNSSSRLIVQEQGFIDVTVVVIDRADVNKGRVVFTFNDEQYRFDDQAASNHGDYFVMENGYTIPFRLGLPGDGSFTASFEDASCLKRLGARMPRCQPKQMISGKIQPFPQILQSDVAFMQTMIAQDYVPYQNATRGKSDSEIASLGNRFFPWSPHSFELAMVIYDWTTASFTRMVLMKVFEYTSIEQSPHPLDLDSIARMIWESNWETFTASDENFMKSFMMRPAVSLADVSNQLHRVVSDLHTLSAVENRLLAAAVYSLPRTSVHTIPLLYSGQVDIQQMGMDRFGIEFLEYPGNVGPVGTPMTAPFSEAVRSFLKPGSVVTTKAVWSFTDNVSEALHYSNGILIIAEPSPMETVWDTATYITDLSDGPEKTEWVFPSGSRFIVRSISVRKVEPDDSSHYTYLHVFRLRACSAMECTAVAAASS